LFNDFIDLALSFFLLAPKVFLLFFLLEERKPEANQKLKEKIKLVRVAEEGFEPPAHGV